MSNDRNMRSVSERALIARINRRIRPDDQKLSASRSAGARMNLGDFFVVRRSSNVVTNHHVDLEYLGRGLGCLAADEQVVLP